MFTMTSAFGHMRLRKSAASPYFSHGSTFFMWVLLCDSSWNALNISKKRIWSHYRNRRRSLFHVALFRPWSKKSEATNLWGQMGRATLNVADYFFYFYYRTRCLSFLRCKGCQIGCSFIQIQRRHPAIDAKCLFLMLLCRLWSRIWILTSLTAASSDTSPMNYSFPLA